MAAEAIAVVEGDYSLGSVLMLYSREVLSIGSRFKINQIDHEILCYTNSNDIIGLGVEKSIFSLIWIPCQRLLWRNGPCISA
jgi:hypothetical protein